MKKIILLFVMLNAMQHLTAQNVGIGTLTPGEKLDVNGNVNVQGNVKVNGVSGTDGQVLMTNNTGATVWSDLCDFKNIASFTQNGTWTIPAGVTKIMIEAWGGGGGGAAGGGGGGGTYIRTQVITVSPGNITIDIGTGGAGAATEAGTASNGTETTVTGAFGTYTARNGGGAGPNFSGSVTLFALVGNSFIQFPGQAGSPTIETYAERLAGVFATIRKYGDGGKTVSLNSSEGKGATFTFNTNPEVTILLIISRSGRIGEGGGGGPTGNGLVWGSQGGPGMVIIHY